MKTIDVQHPPLRLTCWLLSASCAAVEKTREDLMYLSDKGPRSRQDLLKINLSSYRTAILPMTTQDCDECAMMRKKKLVLPPQPPNQHAAAPPSPTQKLQKSASFHAVSASSQIP